MSTRSQVLQNLQVYVKKIEETEYVACSTSERKGYDSQLEGTFKELSERVKLETVALEQVGVTIHVPQPMFTDTLSRSERRLD